MISATLLSLFCLASAQGKEVSFEEKVLGTIPENVTAKDIVFSRDGRQVAYRGFSNGKMYICINNAKGPEYASISDAPRFSPSGKIAYRASNGTQWFAVVGGQPSPPMTMTGIPVFSPDGSKFAYEASRGIGAARDGTGWSVFVAGAKGPDYAACGQPVWSADGSTVAHTVRIAKAGDENRAMHTTHGMSVGGKLTGTEYDEVSSPAFAPKGKMMAFRARTAGSWSMVVDGKNQEAFSQMGEPVFSDDGKRVAYRAEKGGKWTIMADGKRTGEFVMVGDPTFSPDGKKIAHMASDGQMEFIVDGDQQSEKYARVGPPVYSADGMHLAFPARHTSGQWMIVHDGKQSAADFDTVSKPVLSPDGKHVAMPAQWKFRWVLSIDGGKGSMVDYVATPVWSPDSTKVAYVAQNQGMWYVEVNYRRGDNYDQVLTQPYFSSDGKKVAYGVRRGPDLLWRVILVEG